MGHQILFFTTNRKDHPEQNLAWYRNIFLFYLNEQSLMREITEMYVTSFPVSLIRRKCRATITELLSCSFLWSRQGWQSPSLYGLLRVSVGTRAGNIITYSIKRIILFFLNHEHVSSTVAFFPKKRSDGSNLVDSKDTWRVSLTSFASNNLCNHYATRKSFSYNPIRQRE